MHFLVALLSLIAAAPAASASPASLTLGTGVASVAVGVPASAKVGDPVVYQAVVAGALGTPTGTVDFSDNGVPIATCSGAALTAQGSGPSAAAACSTTALGPGSHDITASYSGDGNYATATGDQTYTVFAAGSTTALSASPTNPVTNQQVTLTASITPTVGAASGTVTFSDRGNVLCPSAPVNAVSGTATCSARFASAGSPESLTAAYSPDSNAQAAGSTSPATVLDVGPAGTTTSLTRSSATPAVGHSVTYTATITPGQSGSTTPTGAVTFFDEAAVVSGCAARPLSAAGTATCTVTYSATGTHTITADYPGDGNFSSSASFPPTTVTVQPPPPPAVTATTRHASHLALAAAVLNGLVATHGAAVQWQFQYGTAPPYTHATPLMSIGAGHGNVVISRRLHGLRPGTVYHYELVVIPSGATPSFGAVVAFTTKPLGRLLLPFHAVTVTQKRVAIPARCQSTAPCTGRITIATKPVSSKTKAVMCASVAYRVAPPRPGTVTARLNRACLVMLKPKHRRLTVIVKAAPTSGQLPVTRTGTIVLG